VPVSESSGPRRLAALIHFSSLEPNPGESGRTRNTSAKWPLMNLCKASERPGTVRERPNSLGQFLPPSTNPYHHGLRTEDTTEAQLRVIITDPVFPALVLPSIGDGFNVDIDANGEFVHHRPNCDIEPVLGVRNVGFSWLSRSALAWGCRAVAEWEWLSRSSSPTRTSYGRLAEVGARE